MKLDLFTVREPVVVATHEEMHQTHRQCVSENTLWRDQIASWQGELQQMMLELPKIEATLRDHQSAVQAHADAIASGEQQLKSHEHALADYEHGAVGETLIEMSRTHQAECQRHARQRNAHERIQRHHHGFVAKWNLLQRSLGEPM